MQYRERDHFLLLFVTVPTYNGESLDWWRRTPDTFVAAIMVASFIPAKFDWSMIGNPDVVLQHFPSRRSVVYGTKGVVSSSQPLATEAGLEILRQDGNAGTDVVPPIAIKSLSLAC